MSLDWDVRGLDPEKKARSFPPDENDLMDDKLYALIWLTIPVRIGQLTEDNVDEFYARMITWGTVSGYDYAKHITQENVHDAVGLRTNVANESRGEFLDSMASYMSRNMDLITPEVPDMSDVDFKRDLRRMRDVFILDALEALEGEHEGAFKNNVERIAQLARKIKREADYM